MTFVYKDFQLKTVLALSLSIYILSCAESLSKMCFALMETVDAHVHGMLPTVHVHVHVCASEGTSAQGTKFDCAFSSHVPLAKWKPSSSSSSSFFSSSSSSSSPSSSYSSASASSSIKEVLGENSSQADQPARYSS